MNERLERARWLVWTIAAWQRIRRRPGRHRAADNMVDDRPGADDQFERWRPPYRPPRRLNLQWQADNDEEGRRA